MVIVITGPTGVGKTKLSVELAKRINGEIINGDSIQIYKGLNIGSAKVTKEEMAGIPHHLFDIKEPDEEYSIYDYQKDCRKVIADIISRGKVPIIVGGTGLYIKSALYDYTIEEEAKVTSQYDGIPTSILYQKLLALDKDIKIDEFNRRRVVRALNYYLANNKSIKSNNKGNTLLYDSIFIGLTTDRLELYERINKRVDTMLLAGLLEEVKTFHDKNIRTKPLLNGIGYKELYRYLDQEITLEEALDLIKRNSRRYAKRQYTFFNHQFAMKWFKTNYDDFSKTIEEVTNYITNKEDS